MSSSRWALVVALVPLVSCSGSAPPQSSQAAQPARATATAPAAPCPERAGTTLRFVDVFDGSPASLATLVPDEAGERSGHWKLKYVYDAGRTVTIRCKYANDETHDVTLPSVTVRCDYTIDAKQTLTLTCK
jgi:hypothetical protein